MAPGRHLRVCLNLVCLFIITSHGPVISADQSSYVTTTLIPSSPSQNVSSSSNAPKTVNSLGVNSDKNVSVVHASNVTTQSTHGNGTGLTKTPTAYSLTTDGTAQSGVNGGKTQNGPADGKAQDRNNAGTNPNGATDGTSQGGQPPRPSKKAPTSPKSDSQPGMLNPGLIKLLQQVGANIPGFNDLMNGGFGLSQSQLSSANDFINSIMKISQSNPKSLSDLLSAMASSGLFDSTTLDLTRPPRFPKSTQELCKLVNESTADGNTTVAELLRLSTPLPADIAWMSISLENATYWCLNNFTNSTIERSFPGVPKSHSIYDWRRCQLDIVQMLMGVSTGANWTVQMLDASAKPGSSILKGGFRFMGNYKECQGVSHRAALSTVQGKICRASIKAPFDLPPSPLTAGQEVRFQWDLCVPDSCLDGDLNRALLENNLLPQVYMTCTKDLDISEDGNAILAMGVLVLFGLLLVAGTVMECCVSRRPPKQPSHHGNGHAINGHAHNNHGFDHIESKDEVTSFTEPNGKPPMIEVKLSSNETLYSEADHRNGVNGKAHNGINETKPETPKSPTAPIHRWERALLAFSIPRNTEKILSVKSSPGTIGCLHGIRVLSMAWVILGHTIIMMSVYENPADLFSLVNTLPFQMILNAPLSVDTFFVMSGLLTCYLFMKTMGKKGKVTPKDMALYYIHRYWRLTPSLLIWIMIVSCLVQYIGEGRPAWEDYAAATYCRDYWWTNILYINNVYKQSTPCVGVTWFLAHDMQFYVFAPLALIPWVYGKKILGFLMAFLYVCIHVSSTIWLEIKYNADLLRNQLDYSPEIYFKPYTRAAPFAIGMMLGWVLWKTKCKVRMNKCVVVMGWIIALGLILTLTLVTYDENKDIPASDWSKTGRVVFETFYRPSWALAISWLIFACATGYGGYINSILSWEGWLPLSRLTYSAFLIHLTILSYETYLPEYTKLFTLTTLSYFFLGTFVMAYAVGYILTITVESPMLALEKVVLG